MEDNNISKTIKKYDLKLSKKLGQNFLKDKEVLEKIVEKADIHENDHVIEIGPGIGVLTKELLKKNALVDAIELDDRLIPILTEEFKGENNFILTHADALKVDYEDIIKDKKSKVVANIPYYLTTPLIVKLISSKYNLDTITLMIQKEVGERICAKSSTKDYGSITLLVNYYCKSEILFYVDKSSFQPVPKVDSIVIKLNILEKPAVDVISEDLFFNVIKASFNMRRKTILNALKSLNLPKEVIVESLEKSNIDMVRRGETLSIEEFALLSNNLYNIKN